MVMGLVSYVRLQLREAKTSDEYAVLFRAVSRGLLQDVKLYSPQNLRNHEHDAVLGQLCAGILHGLVPDDTPQEVWNEGLNALLLAWDAQLAVADAPHTVFCAASNMHWYSITDDAWFQRYGKYRRGIPVVPPSGALCQASGEPVRFLSQCAAFLEKHLTAGGFVANVRKFELLTACLRLFVREHIRLCSRESRDSIIPCAGLMRGMTAFMHSLADTHRSGDTAKDETTAASLACVFGVVVHEFLRLVDHARAPAQKTLVRSCMPMVWEDIFAFQNTAWFGDVVSACATWSVCRLSSVHVRALLSSSIKTKYVAKLLRLHAARCRDAADGSDAADGASDGADAAEDAPEQPLAAEDVVQQVLEARGVAILPAVLKWVRKTRMCTRELFGVITRVTRTLFESWNASDSSAGSGVPDFALLRTVILLYDELAACSEVSAVWLHAKDVVSWAFFRAAAPALPNPLRTFARHAPLEVVESVNVDKLRAGRCKTLVARFCIWCPPRNEPKQIYAVRGAAAAAAPEPPPSMATSPLSPLSPLSPEAATTGRGSSSQPKGFWALIFLSVSGSCL